MPKMDMMDIDSHELEDISESSILITEVKEHAVEDGYISDVSSSSSSVEFILGASQQTPRSSSYGTKAQRHEFASVLTLSEAQEVLEDLLDGRPEILKTVEEWASLIAKREFEIRTINILPASVVRGMLSAIFDNHIHGQYDSFESFLRAAKHSLEARSAAQITWSLNTSKERHQNRRTSFDLPVLASTQLPVEDRHGVEAAGLMSGFNKMTLLHNPAQDLGDEKARIRDICTSMMESATQAEKQTIVHNYEKIFSHQNEAAYDGIGCNEQACYGESCGFAGCRFRENDMSIDDGGDFERLERYWNEALIQHYWPLAEMKFREGSRNKLDETLMTNRDEGTGKRTHSTAFSRSGNEKEHGHKKQNCTRFQMPSLSLTKSSNSRDRQNFGKTK